MDLRTDSPNIFFYRAVWQLEFKQRLRLPPAILLLTASVKMPHKDKTVTFLVSQSPDMVRLSANETSYHIICLAVMKIIASSHSVVPEILGVVICLV